MAVDSAAWVENLKEYLEPVAKAALEVKEQLEGYDYPPAMVDAYKTAAAAVGVEDVSPVYVGAGVIAASSVLYLAYGCSSSAQKPKPSSGGRGKKKSKVKSKVGAASPTANGSVHKNRAAGTGTAGSAINGSRPRDLPGKQPKSGGAGSGGPPAPAVKATAKSAKKLPATAPQPQGKGKGKAAPEAPPVITEEPAAAKKRTRKKKASQEAKAAAAAAAAPKKAPKKKASAANGSTASDGGASRAGQNGGDTGELDPWGGQTAGGEWQTGPIGSPEGEWETVSHKKSRPRKERAAADDANVIPGGLGL